MNKKTRDIFPFLKKEEDIVCTQEEYKLLLNNHPELWDDSEIFMSPTHLSVGVQSCERCDVCMQPELCASSLYIIMKKE